MNYICAVRRTALRFAGYFCHDGFMANFEVEQIARLGQIVKERREELGVSQKQLLDRGGPSNSTLTKIEQGRADTISNATMRKIDRALDWEFGSAQEVLAGGDPTVSGERRYRTSGGEEFSERTLETLVENYSNLKAEQLNVMFQYAKARSIDFNEAGSELEDVFYMANQLKDGRQWTPPWRPYPDGFEPWKELWWQEPRNRKKWASWKHGGEVLTDEQADEMPDPAPNVGISMAELTRRLSSDRTRE